MSVSDGDTDIGMVAAGGQQLANAEASSVSPGYHTRLVVADGAGF